MTLLPVVANDYIFSRKTDALYTINAASCPAAMYTGTHNGTCCMLLMMQHRLPIKILNCIESGGKAC